MGCLRFGRYWGQSRRGGLKAENGWFLTHNNHSRVCGTIDGAIVGWQVLSAPREFRALRSGKAVREFNQRPHRHLLRAWRRARLAGAAVTHPNLQAVLWAIDGAALVMAAVLLAVKYFRKGDHIVASRLSCFCDWRRRLAVGPGDRSGRQRPVIHRRHKPCEGTALLLISTPMFAVPIRILGALSAIRFIITRLESSRAGCCCCRLRYRCRVMPIRCSWRRLLVGYGRFGAKRRLHPHCYELLALKQPAVMSGF